MDDDHSHLLATRQLHVIDELGGVLDRARIPYWLIGGWAMDFHVGRISRQHSDVDLAVHLGGRDSLLEVIRRQDFTAATGNDVAGVELFIGRGIRLEVTYLAVREDGCLCTPGHEHWPYPAGSFGDERATLHGVGVPVMSVAGLLELKEGWRREIGEPLRPHDLADIHALRQLMSVFDPASAG